MKLLISILIILISWGIANAQAPEYFTLARASELDFEPKACFFIFEQPEEHPSRAECTYFSAPQGKGALKVWLAGIRLMRKSFGEALRYSVLLLGDGNQYKYLPPQTVALSDLSSLIYMSSDNLRSSLLQHKQSTSEIALKVKQQQENLERLRDDADLIGGFGRIIEIREMTERTKEEIAHLKNDMDNLKSFLNMARARPEPRNFSRREFELTRQIAELAEVAKNSEGNELTGRLQRQAEIQRKLAAIESTRYDNYEDLVEELNRARKKRQELELARTPR